MNERSFAMKSNVLPSSPSVTPVPHDNQVKTACSRGLLALLLLLALPTVVQAQFTFTTNGDNTITITGYTGPGGVVTIPDTTNGLSVTSIGTNAFADFTTLTSVIIPSSVRTLDDEAFSQCFALTNVYCQGNPLSLGSSVFSGDTNATAYYLAIYAFAWRTPLDGLPTMLNPAEMFNYVTTNGAVTILSYHGPSGSLAIPSTIYGVPVTSIGDAPMSYTGLFSVTFPSTLTNIGSSAFNRQVSLTNVIIPDNVIRLGDAAFAYCYALTNVVIGNGLTSLGISEFDSCSALVSVTLGTNITSIGGSAFNQCTKLATVSMGNSVTSFGDSAFYACNSLRSVTIGDSVTNIGNSTFYGCISLTNVTIGNGVTTIGNTAFWQCNNLMKAVIGNSVTNIGSGAFQGCFSLTNVTVGENVSTIKASAFSGDSKLTGVYFRGNAPSVGQFVFSSATKAIVYYLPGSTGWGSTLGGQPAVLWNPQAQTGDGSFGVLSNQFGFNITGTTNIPLVAEACTNLANASWTALQTCTLTNGSIYFSDPAWTNYPGRFYRIRSP